MNFKTWKDCLCENVDSDGEAVAKTQPLVLQCKSALVSDCRSDNVPSWFPLLSRLPEFSLLHVRFVSGNTLKGLGKGFPGSWLSFAFFKASLTTVLCNVMILPWYYHYSKSNASTFWVWNVDKAKVLNREPQSHFSLRFGKRCLWQPDSRIFQLCTHGAETGVLLGLALGAEVTGTVWCWAKRGASSAQEL